MVNTELVANLQYRMEPLFPVCVLNLICVVVAGEQCAEETRSCDSKDECFHFIGKGHLSFCAPVIRVHANPRSYKNKS